MLLRDEAKYASQTRVRLFVAVRNTHATTCGDVESREVAILVNNRNEANIVSKEINIIIGWDSDGYFELEKSQLVSDITDGRDGDHLARKIEFAVQGLNVLDRVTCNHLLVQPDFVVSCGTREETLADGLRELVCLSMQLRPAGDRRRDNVTKVRKNIS